MFEAALLHSLKIGQKARKSFAAIFIDLFRERSKTKVLFWKSRDNPILERHLKQEWKTNSSDSTRDHDISTF